MPTLGRRASASADQPTGNKYVLLNEIAEYLRLASQTRPLVIVLDDMQWADSASWDMLEHLMPHLESDRLLLCLTIRAEDARGDVITRRRRLSRDERFHEFVLSRLTPDELAQWMQALFPRQDITGLLPLLFRHSEGNPLLVTQLLRTMLDE